MIWLLLGCISEQAEPIIADVLLDSPFESASECKDCHPTQYEEWSKSMHAYAAKSPVFDAMSLKAYRDSGGENGTFCTGCHSPLGESVGESGALVAQDRSDIGSEGVSCDYCHTAVGHDGIIGNNRLQHEPGDIKTGPFASDEQRYHLNVKSDFLQSPVLCGSCHDVFAYPGILIEQAYSEYIESPAAEQGQRCQDCHMSPIPGLVSQRPVGPAAVVAGEVFPDRELSSHRFVGPDYSLIDGFPYADDLAASSEAQQEQLEQIKILLKNAVQISDLRMERNGTDVEIVVELESLTSGHRVPTGFTSERQLWVHVQLRNSIGQLLYESGGLDSNGDLYDAHSQMVIEGEAQLDHDLINLQSRNLSVARQYSQNGGLLSILDDRVEAETIFPFDADYIERRSLAPLERRPILIDIEAVPDGALDLSAELRYRNLPPYLLRALNLEELVERLVIIDIDSAEATLP